MAFQQFLWRRVMCGWFQTSPADCSTLLSATDRQGYLTLKCPFLFWIGFVHGVYKMRGWASGLSLALHNKGKGSIILRAQTQFSWYSLHIHPTSVFYILSVRTLENHSVFSWNWKWRYVTTHFLRLSGNLKQRRDIRKDATFLDVSMHALIRMEYILGICLNCDWIDN
jgi:hypothetical protein